MRIVHLTDAHLSSLRRESLLALRGKRRLGYLSWWRHRRHQLDAAILVPVTAGVAADAPDLIVVTGDLVHLGLPHELAAARNWLARLRAISEVVLVPGNHDCYQADAQSAMSAQWADYLHVNGSETFPSQVTDGEVSVIGLSSAQPMPWWSAAGALGAAQLARLAQLLTASAGRFRCVLLHHPPLPGLAPRRKALHDAPALAALLRQHGVELVLHGHSHRNRSQVFAERTRIMVTAPAASRQRDNPASYRVIDIARDGALWRVQAQLKCLDIGAGTMAVTVRDAWVQSRR